MKSPRLFCIEVGWAAAIAAASAALVTFVVLSADAANLPPGFTETQFGSNLSGRPTAMEFAPDGRLFVCLQTGQVRVIKNGLLLPKSFLDIAVDSSGERGLLGIAFDPNFATNHHVYVYYTVSTSPIHNRVSRFTAAGDVA
ncbi:MAG: glucose dehydrogenase, partial [Verrucomicrobia bacterium]